MGERQAPPAAGVPLAAGVPVEGAAGTGVPVGVPVEGGAGTGVPGGVGVAGTGGVEEPAGAAGEGFFLSRCTKLTAWSFTERARRMRDEG